MYITELIEKDLKLENLYKKDSKITGVTDDSRKVKPGMVFVAVKGNKVNGISFLNEAIAFGASTVVCTKRQAYKIKEKKVNIISSRNTRLGLALISKKIYPLQPSNIVAVTGTNGKTSINNYLFEIWKANNIKALSIGTLGIRYDKTLDKTIHTTPEAPILHKELHKAKRKQIEHAVLEASSHALHQSRIDAVNIICSVFTNLSRDHLDYHKTFKNYFSCKVKLFNKILNKNGFAVINIDNKYGEKVLNICKCKDIKAITYGTKKKCIWQLKKIKKLNSNQAIVYFKFKKTQYSFKSTTLSKFQNENILCAIAIAHNFGIPLNNILSSIPEMSHPKGRLNKVSINMNEDISVFIDYAHTPEALKNVLEELRKIKNKKGKLNLVFGCGGDRDKGKRKLMGKIANDLADIVYITDDNPRFENPASIRKEIIRYCKKSYEIASRKEAIFQAVKELKEKDLLLIAGKGHEQKQELNGKTFPFNDEKIAKIALKKRKK